MKGSPVLLGEQISWLPPWPVQKLKDSTLLVLNLSALNTNSHPTFHEEFPNLWLYIPYALKFAETTTTTEVLLQ